MPSYRHPRPCVTVDLLVVCRNPAGDQLLLIRRGQAPFAGMWALPGGFVEVGDEPGQQGEDLVDAAVRELEEETGVSGLILTQVGAFGTPDRDPRHRSITVLFRAELDHTPHAQGGSDATDARWTPVEDVLTGKVRLAFDHLDLVYAGLMAPSYR